MLNLSNSIKLEANLKPASKKFIEKNECATFPRSDFTQMRLRKHCISMDSATWQPDQTEESRTFRKMKRRIQ